MSTFTEPFKDILLQQAKEFKELFQYFNKGHLEMMKYYGDVDSLIAENNLDPPPLDAVAIPDTIAVPEQRSGPYTSTSSKAKVNTNNPASRNRSLAHPRRSTPAELEKNEYGDQNLAVVPYEPKVNRTSKS